MTKALLDRCLDRSMKSSNHQVDPIDFPTYEEWENNALTIYDRDWYTGGTHHTRCAFWMQGYTICVETLTPWNVFKDSLTWCTVDAFDISPFSDIMKFAKKHGAEFEEHVYASDGKGCPKFSGEDCVKQCWDFLTAFRQAELYKKVPVKDKKVA
jgi:hypothetical protein